MSYYIYIIQSLKYNSYYIGSSKNPHLRLNQHNSGKVKSTKHKKPYKLIYLEKFDTRQEAYKRELKIKSYKGGRAFKKLIGVGTEAVKRGRL